MALNATLSALKMRAAEGEVVLNEATAPGISLSLDPEGTDYATTLTSLPDSLISLRFSSPVPGRWATLNLELGPKGFGAWDLLGLALRCSAPRTLAMRTFIRTYSGGSFRDTPFRDHILAYPQPLSHVDGLWIDEAVELSGDADWRTLIIALDPAGCELSLSHVRVFAT